VTLGGRVQGGFSHGLPLRRSPKQNKITMVDKAKLAELMEEQNIKRPGMTQYPMIRLEGNEGKFLFLELTDEGYAEPEEMDKTFKGAIIAVRTQMAYMTDDDSAFTSEYDSPKEKVALFEPTTNSVQKVDEGTQDELRISHPKLKLRKILYVLTKDMGIVKVQVKGGGLVYLFDFFKEFSNKEHIFEFMTEFGFTQERNEKMRKNYYAMTFEKGDLLTEAELGAVADHIEIFHEERKAAKAYYAQSRVEVAAPDLEVVPEDIEEEPEEEEEDPHPFG
jgi:hypothetical protein